MSLSNTQPSAESLPSTPGGTVDKLRIYPLRPDLIAKIVGRDEEVIRQMIGDDTERARVAREVEDAIGDPRLLGDPKALERFRKLYPDYQEGQIPSMLDETAERLKKGEKILAQKKTFFEKMKSTGGWAVDKTWKTVTYPVRHPVKTVVVGGAVVIGGAILAALGMSGMENFYKQVGMEKLVEGTKSLLPLGEIAAGDNPGVHGLDRATGPMKSLPPTARGGA